MFEVFTEMDTDGTGTLDQVMHCAKSPRPKWPSSDHEGKPRPAGFPGFGMEFAFTPKHGSKLPCHPLCVRGEERRW